MGPQGGHHILSFTNVRTNLCCSHREQNPDQSVLHPEEARQSLNAKEKLERKIEVLKQKVELHSDSHPTTFKPHPPTPPTTNPHPTTSHPHPSTPSTTNSHPTTIKPYLPTPSHIQNNLSSKHPTRHLDTHHFTHIII